MGADAYMTNYVCNTTYELVEKQNFTRTGEPDKASSAHTPSKCWPTLLFFSKCWPTLLLHAVAGVFCSVIFGSPSGRT